MSKDPYQTLGVSPHTPMDKVKQAYRELAKKYHPDRGDTNPSHLQRFKEINAAYRTIKERNSLHEQMRKTMQGQRWNFGQKKPHFSDPRSAGAHYSTFSSHRTGSAKGSHHSTGTQTTNQPHNWRGVFADFLKQKRQETSGASSARPGTHSDQTYTPRPKNNANASANSQHYLHEKRLEQEATISDVYLTLEATFAEAALGATKTVSDKNRTFEVRIPAGCEDGQLLRLRHAGSTPQGRKSDLVVCVRVQAHPFFTRKGQDVHVQIPISLREAILGGRLKVPSLDGPLALTVPPGTSSGKILRLKQHGIGLRTKPAQRGDFYVVLHVALPPTSPAMTDFATMLPEQHKLRDHLFLANS